MAKKKKDVSILDVLAEAPWWVGVTVAVIAFIGMRFIVPNVGSSSDPISTKLVPDLAPVLSFILLIPAAFSYATSLKKRRLLDRQSGLESVRALSWKQLEELTAEAFRRRGFTVNEHAHRGPDGGVDLFLRRDGNLYLVQCKHWRSSKVGVTVVREMLGLVTAHRAHGAIIVTTGLFTHEARAFASGVPVDLIEGHAFADLVLAVRSGPRATAPSPGSYATPPAPIAPPQQVAPPRSAMACPRCGHSLVVRRARRGAQAGSEFLGCSSFPECRHTQPLDPGTQPMMQA